MDAFVFSKRFKKNFAKLRGTFQARVGERLKLFSEDNFSAILQNHKLHGKYEEYRSINVTADIRIIFRKMGEDRYFLLDIGTHSELYS